MGLLKAYPENPPTSVVGSVKKKLACIAIKGGVGKSSIVANLGLALKALGYKVGFLDVDVTSSNLYSALGLEFSPKWILDSRNKKIIVPEIDGSWLLSVASYAGEEYAILWEGSHFDELSEIKSKIGKLKDLKELKGIQRQIDDILASSKWRFVSELLSDEVVTWPESLDFLIADLPPSTSAEMFSFLEHVNDLFGVIIVSQPAVLSTIGLRRTIDLLRMKKIPILGLVANQDGFLTSHGDIEYQFLSPRVNLQEVASKAKIPLLISIPQTADREKIKPYFSELAKKVIDSKPVVLKEVTFGRKLKREFLKGIARRL